MFGPHTSFEIILTAESDIHIGGHVVEFEEEGIERHFAGILRDSNENPYLPGTSMKGALRSLLSDRQEAALAFGTAEPEAGQAPHVEQTAQLWIRDAYFESVSDESLEALGKIKPSADAYFRTNVALNEKTAASDRSKLFTQEMIPMGSKFRMSGDWFGETFDTLKLVIRQLMLGFSVGRGNKLGDGRLRILGATDITFTSHRMDERTLKLVEADWSEPEIAAFVQACYSQEQVNNVYTLTLTCDGPFISVFEAREDEATGNKSVLPMRRHSKAYLQASSVLGALRSRARWLSEVARASKSDIAYGQAVSHEPTQSIDRRFGDAPALQKPEDLQHLSTIERLFGVPGLQGRVRICDVQCLSCGGELPMTANSIDRISGGVRKGFLYTHSVFECATFKVELYLAERPGQSDDEEDLFDALLKDISDGPPIELGHGGSKGMGWFGVTVEPPTRENAQ